MARLSRPTAALLVLLTLPALRLSAAGREILPGPDTETLASARRTLFEALDSRDPQVRRAAIVMLRYEGNGEAYGKIAALFRDFASPVLEPGLPLYQMEALATLNAIDPDRTVRWLQEHNDEVLERFDLYELFSAIGFSRMTDFDNLFLYTRAGYGTLSPRRTELQAIHVAEAYRKTGEEKYRRILAFSAADDFEGGPEELRRLYEYLRSRGLPVEPLRYLMEERGGLGVGKAVVMRSFTLEELLYQALLYRFGCTGEVYRTRFNLSDTSVLYASGALERHGFQAPRETFGRVLGELGVFPTLALNEAAACLYAGSPRPGDAETIGDGMAPLPPAEQLRYLQVIVASPESGQRRALLRRYAASTEAHMRKAALAALVSCPGYRTREEVLLQLEEERDPEAIGFLLEALGNQDSLSNADVFARHLAHGSGIVRSVAAGQLLRSGGAGGRP